MRKTVIKTNIIRVSHQRLDGASQLKVLVKVGYNYDSIFRELRRYEIGIRDKFNKTYTVTNAQYNRLKQSPPTTERLQLFSIENKIKKIIIDLIENNKKFSIKDISSRLYEIQAVEAVDEKVNSWNDFLNRVSSEEDDLQLQKGEIDRIEKAVEEIIYEQGYITEDEVDDIRNSVGVQIQIEKDKEYVKTLNLDERYSMGRFDRNNIIELFGYCWSKNPKNGDPYIAYSYRHLIFHLTDYILNGDSVKNSVSDFNLDWVEGFLTFKINKGFPKTHFSGYTPFDIFDRSKTLTQAPREYFKISSFQRVVKIMRHYINILQKESLLPMTIINTNHIKASDFISRSTNKDSYTKIEFTLEYEEIEQLLSASFDDPKMQLAVDMYIIQMFAGGLRPIEMYNDNLRFTDNCVSFYRSKTKRVSKNPILQEVRDVLNKYPDGLPKFLNISTYRLQLKAVAKEFEWKRTITEPNTRIKSKKNVIEHELQEVFSPLTARKTFINYLANLGLPDELIIQFTDHTDVKILKHYKRRLYSGQKRKVMVKLIEYFKPYYRVWSFQKKIFERPHSCTTNPPQNPHTPTPPQRGGIYRPLQCPLIVHFIQTN